MRVFVAINISSEVQNYLKNLQKDFYGLGDFKFVKSFHLTLKFFGWVKDKDVARIDKLLKKIQYKKFSLQLNNLGVFPSIGGARVLWVGLDGDMRDLWHEIEGTLKKDFGSDDRFKEHITLARIKSIKDKDKFRKLLGMKIKKLKFDFVDFRLMQSELRQTGPIYSDLKIYKLK